ncbi:MAG: hypothetical protein IKN78_04390 [Bacteroidales bacterium]|nr:hypothetical protein [Bacteroidales bacterium]
MTRSRKFIRNAYHYSTDSIFVVCKLNPSDLHQQWVGYLSVPEPEN